MKMLLDKLNDHARRHRERVVFRIGTMRLTWGELVQQVQALSARLRQRRIQRLGLLAPNGSAWAIADLAALHAGCCLVPLPTFFSDDQLAHIKREVALDAVLATTDQHHRLASRRCDQVTPELFLHEIASGGSEPLTCTKITFTSGTTGKPKGVCLGATAMMQVVESLVDVTGIQADHVHACVLPLSTLLENLGGLYRALIAGATIWFDPEVATCLAAPDGGARLVDFLVRSEAASAILTPGHLGELVAALMASKQRLPALRFLAVGGAPTDPVLAEAARRLQLPLYEGYGLSEAASVVTLNTPTVHRLGSVGRPLPHVDLRLAPNGDIQVRGALFNGYLHGEPQDPSGFWSTGDIGELDEDGFLYVHGRQRPFEITGYGRNIDPRWLSELLTREAAIDAARVVVDRLPAPIAQIGSACPAAAVEAAIDRVNAHLPAYARIARWSRLSDQSACPNREDLEL